MDYNDPNFYNRPQEELLAQFLLDVTRLDELLPPPAALLFEPIIKTREEVIRIGEGSRIDGFVKLEGGALLDIGRYVHIASFAHINIGGGATIIEDYAAVASGGKIVSGSNQVDAPSMSAVAPKNMQRVTGGAVKLCRFSCVLTNATVLPNVTLHEGAVLGANSLATKDIPAWEIWVGTPARFLKRREVKR